MKIKTINDFRVGDREKIVHTITEDDVQKFAELTGDLNPLHIDKNFARQTDFKKPVVYGMLSASFISTLIGMKLPGSGALWTSQSLEFLHQVYINDTLEIEGIVTQISKATQTMILKILVKNQNNEEILRGESTVKLLQLDNEMINEDRMKKICLVTGGTSDIGSAVIEEALKNNYAVALNYSHNETKAREIFESMKQFGEIFPYKADLSNADQIDQMIQNINRDLGTITAVVHCAAPRNKTQTFSEIPWLDMQNQFEVQIGGLFNCLKKVLPAMIENEIAGKIIVISSISTDNVPPDKQYDYVVTKSALSSFAKCLAVEYSPKKIAVNIVAPGMTETERIVDVPQKAKLLTKMQSPSRALIQPREVARAVAFLLQQDSCSITGETIRVCGGINMI